MFPTGIATYRIKASSTPEELMTLGRYYSEIAGYASTIPDKEHRQLAKTCGKRLDRIVATLRDRGIIDSSEELYQVPDGDYDGTPLEEMTVDDLYRHYRQRPQRSDRRMKAGREPFTFYTESRIINELRKREAADMEEQLKIDFCKAVYRIEIDNLAFVLGKPKRDAHETLLYDSSRSYSKEELAAFITLYRNYRTVEQREALIECVDRALNMIESADDKRPYLHIMSELSELNLNHIVHCPEWIDTLIAKAIRRWTNKRDIADTDIVMPMLSLAMSTKEWTLHPKATRIINRCYRSVTALNDSDTDPQQTDLDKKIDELYIAMTCNQFVTKLSSRKIVSAWNTLTTRLLSKAPSLPSDTSLSKAPTHPSTTTLSKDTTLSPIQLYRLLKSAKEFEGYGPLSKETQTALQTLLQTLSKTGNTEAAAYISAQLTPVSNPNKIYPLPAVSDQNKMYPLAAVSNPNKM